MDQPTQTVTVELSPTEARALLQWARTFSGIPNHALARAFDKVKTAIETAMREVL